MEKRIFLAVLISLAVLWSWAVIAPKLFPDLVKKPAVQTTTSATSGSGSTAAATSAASSTSPASTTTGALTTTAAPAVVVAAGPQTPIAAQSLVVTTVDAPEFVARFSNRGAQLVSFQLRNFKARGGHFVELVKSREPGRTDFPFAIESPNAALQHANGALFVLNDHMAGNVRVLEYRYAGDGVSVTKTFRVDGDYLFNFAVAVAPATPYRVMVGPGIRNLEADEVDSRVTMTGNGVYQVNDKLKDLNREKGGDNFTVIENAQYVGVEDNYFLAVIKPEKSGAAALRRGEFPPASAGGEKRKELYAGVNAAPDGTVAGSSFFGPKVASVLDKYGFERTLRFGMFGIIARFFLAALVWINKYTRNYGFAIIVLTILIKMVLYPLQHKWIVSMKKMQKIQPKMEAVKARYKKARTDPDQRQKMNNEMMNLYKTEGINPAGGCLPMLVQFPIFVGFYNLLAHSIELRGAPFILWIHDLSAKDPSYVLPLLMTVAMFVQQWITPSTADPAQKKAFMFVPIVFGWIFKEFAAGLVIYWLVQNVLTIVQQLIMNKWWKDHPTELQKA
ncbi:MAG: membrane protein insertase YidC [Acidobacteriota bacterium]